MKLKIKQKAPAFKLPDQAGKIHSLADYRGRWILPNLWVMVCKRGAYELLTNPDSQPELQGEARFMAEKPIIEWKPELMD
jgi:peroxiredoxin